MSIEVGRVVHWKSGRYLVVEVFQKSIAICPIDRSPVPRHRADLYLTDAECFMLGLLSDSSIRCIPFALRAGKVEEVSAMVCHGLVDKVKIAIDREVAARVFEDGNAKK